MATVLRVLGRNWNFDDIAEATLMGENDGVLRHLRMSSSW
jgi:hypothetical protein